MAELADALDLESSSHGVQVRFLLPAPNLIELTPIYWTKYVTISGGFFI